MSKINVVSWNVRGLNSAVKRSLVFTFLQRFSPHICILQETHLLGSRKFGLKKKKLGLVLTTMRPTQTMLGGVSVLIHRSQQFQLLEVRIVPEERYVLMHALVTGIQFIIVGLCLLHPTDVALLSSVMHMVT